VAETPGSHTGRCLRELLAASSAA